MGSRQYIVRLLKVKKVHSYRVYADRSVEVGQLVRGQFERAPENQSQKHDRAYVASLIEMARGFGYDVKREWL